MKKMKMKFSRLLISTLYFLTDVERILKKDKKTPEGVNAGCVGIEELRVCWMAMES